MEFIHLIGTEAVQAAGTRISSAAEDMRQAASNIESSLRLHQQFLDNWLVRFEEIVNRIAAEG